MLAISMKKKTTPETKRIIIAVMASREAPAPILRME